MTGFLALAAEQAIDTVTYLMAWWGVPVWAFLAAVLLLDAGRRWPAEEWVRSEDAARRIAGAFLLAVARPFGREQVRRTLARSEGRPGTTAVYLAAGHCLTLYYFFLLGPLLGKDVLLSHVLGVAMFVLFAAALARLFGASGAAATAGARGDVPGPPESGGAGEARPDDSTPEGTRADAGDADRPSLLQLALGEGTRFGGWALWGLAVGGAVGAAGLTDPSLHLTELLPGRGLGRQAVHAVAGLLAAPLTFMWPVATLFAGTFLWKVGLAHAGLVAFFCAATVSPQRIRLYRRAWGPNGARRWAAALGLAAAAAGLVVAVLFGLTGLDIRYKLTPVQMWTP